jgi:hypothetical protein
MFKRQESRGKKYASMDKDHGPPKKHWAVSYDELEHNEYLQKKGISKAEVMHPAALARAENQ